jgi:hypothetical protein
MFWIAERLHAMGITTVFKSEVQDILVAIRLAADATAASSGGTVPEPSAFLEGYHAALEAVAAALGLELPSSTVRNASMEEWTRGPRAYATPRLREWSSPSPG